MTVKAISFNNVGQAGQFPQFIYIDTDNTVAQVTATGFLNKLVAEKFPISEKQMAVVTTQTTPSATTSQVNLFNITFASGNWSLTANSTPISLANGQIFVGNAGGVATGVTMSGDATITNTGVLTIANAAINAAKIQDFNVSYSKLSSTWAPTSIIKYFGIEVTVGGGIQETFNIPGADPSQDIAFVQMQSDTTGAIVLKTEVPLADTIRVTWTVDPGAGNAMAYQLVRNAF